MASAEQLRKIPLYCDKYLVESIDEHNLTNSVSDKHDSCIKCAHYNEKGLCNLGLIDKVLSSMSMELDFKS
ncbi:hypothetical protein [Paratissierella segnis]|jgi:hypothetical protein|uniref:Uncharacterized protein n=1 Tax=Paratissierella segnis TaxID=2763679 RepID=A0A926EZG5_9FIRM|nr:hypothetical protein [Paratissierella segnis]MBC8589134.1 hypothetical protein [Paratissierella segnis]